MPRLEGARGGDVPGLEGGAVPGSGCWCSWDDVRQVLGGALGSHGRCLAAEGGTTLIQPEGGGGVAALNHRVPKSLGVWKGGGCRPVSRRGPGGGGGGTPTYTPQNDPHDALIIMGVKKVFRKICPSTQAPISQGPTRRSGQGLFCVFQTFLNSLKNSEFY